MRRCRKTSGRAGLLVAFGVGVIVAYIFPHGFVIVLLTLALISLGLLCCRL